MDRRHFLTGCLVTATGACAAVPRSDIARRWPPEGRIISVEGTRVHVWEKGQGTPVVLIHGASGNLRDWTFALADRIARTRRVIAFDRPGFGYSDRIAERGWDPAVQAALLARATHQVGAARPIVVGHSWGGALAMAWAADAPELRGVVTLGGATMPWGGDLGYLYRLGASDVLGAVVGEIVSTVATEGLIRSFLADTFAPQPIPEGYADYVGGPLATRPEVVRYNARDIANLNARLTIQSRRYDQIRTPVEILHGTEDKTVYPDVHARAMHAVLPNSTLTLLDGIGHMPHHARPEALMAALERLDPQG